jgi:large subunit ribosomal protein L23
MSVIIKPLVTEKMTDVTDKLGKFGFIVDRRANKIQIRKAIEEMYGVTVTDVRTMNYMGKKSVRFTTHGPEKGSKASFKKAIISLAEGDSIDLYSGI